MHFGGVGGRGKGREQFGVGAGETGLVSLPDQLRNGLRPGA